MLAAAACGSSPGGPDEGNLPPDDRGTLVSFDQPVGFSGFVWSPDSREIFLLTHSSSSYRLRAYDPVAETQRVVAEGAGSLRTRISESGEWLYYMDFASASRDVFRVSREGGNPERVTTGGSQLGFGLSGDARYVAYVSTPHTVAVFDTRDQTRREFSVPDAGAVGAMSPDGGEIEVTAVFAGGSAVDVLATDDGTVRRVHSRPESPAVVFGASWKGGALHLLLMTAGLDQAGTRTFRERNRSTDAETILGAISAAGAADT